MGLSRDLRIAVFASGNGGNFAALADAAGRGELGGAIAIAALFCDQPSAPAIARAKRRGIEVVQPPTGRHRTRLEDERPWLGALEERRIDVVLLAGFMRRLHATLLQPFAGRMLNIHPSLLPAFPGLDAIGQAWRHGVRVTGCTVHFVEDALDSGPIVAQGAVPVDDHDTLESLAARMHAAEHALYAPAVHRVLTEPWRVEGRVLTFGDGQGLALPGGEVVHG